MCVGVNISEHLFLFGNTKLSIIGTPRTKLGVWAGRRLKQRNARNTTKLGRKR